MRRTPPAALLLLALLTVDSCHSPPSVPSVVVGLPTARHGHRVEPIGGGLLAFGGFGDADTPDRGARETWWLAPDAEGWVRRADMGTERAFFATVVDGAGVLAIGDGVERYDFDADRWSTVVAPGALPVSHFAAARVDGTLFVLGGFPLERSGFFAVEIATGAVRREPPPPGFEPGDHFHVMHELAGRLHVIGGLRHANFETRTEHWVRSPKGWEALPPPPPGIWAKFATHAVAGDDLYLFGDFGGFRFESTSGTWSPRAPLPVIVVMAPGVVVGAAIWVVGGMVVDRPDAPLLLRYDLATDRWEDRLAPASAHRP